MGGHRTPRQLPLTLFAPSTMRDSLGPLLIPGLAILLALASPASAQRTKPPVPDLTADGQPDDKHDWNLGPTGARGWMWGWKLETLDARQIFITEVAPGSPSKGVLEVGDVLLGVGDAPFDGDPRFILGSAISVAEGKGGKGRLPLLVWRAGATKVRVIQLPQLGDYADTAPWECSKSQTVLDAACEHMAGHMKGDIDGMMNALALLATGREEYQEAVAQLAHRVGRPDMELTLLGRDSGLFAWEWAYRNLFLCEYYLATRDKAVMPAILEYSETMAEGQSGVGTWGHGMAWPDLNNGELHGSLGGYGAVNQAGLVCHLSLVLAQMCGVKSDEVNAAVERANAFASFYSGKGAIPYGDHRPGWATHDDNGKNSLAALIFDLQGRDEEAAFFARMTVASYDERERGHTGNYFSYLWGALGAGRAGPLAAAAFMGEQRWFYDLARRFDGSFDYQGGAGMGGGEHKYDGWDCTGAFVLGSALPEGKLYITGRGRDTAGDLTPSEVAETIGSGRGFDSWTMGKDHYAAKSTEELNALLSSWSPAVRTRAATALAPREDAPIKGLIALLGSDRPEGRYGACQALGALKARAASAVPALTESLAEDDAWLRIQAAYALAGIGDAARSAVPSLLKLAVVDDPADPREFVQRFLAFSLFYRGGALGARGLLARSVEGVDRSLLLPAVARLLKNDDGRARGAVGSVYKLLTLEELQPILPDILEAIRTPSPSGVMFSSGIRLSGLDFLGEHRIAEGMDLCFDVLEIHKWGKKVRIRKALESLEHYGGAARPILPRLRQLKADLEGHQEAKNLAGLVELCQSIVDSVEGSEETPELRSLKDLNDASGPVSPKPARPRATDRAADDR